MPKIKWIADEEGKFYPPTIPQAVIDPTSGKSARAELDEKANHGYESGPKTLKAVDDAKVDKSSIVGETGQGETTVMHQKAVTDELSAKADLVGGKVPSGQLPSYVDDVVEVATSASLPATGEQGKIYITTDTDAQYRWTGTAYRNISNPVDFATQGEAEGNSENTKAMTSLRVFQSFVKNCASYVFSALNTTSKTLVGAINDLHSGLATKASHGYESNPKTLKEVDDNLAQLAGEVMYISDVADLSNSSNLIDKSQVVLDSVYGNSDGLIYTVSGRGRTGKIQIQDNFTYTLKGSKINYSFAIYYNSDDVYIGYANLGEGSRKVFTTPAGASYVGINFADSNAATYVDTLQLNEGDVDISYEEYYVDKITIKESVLPQSSGGGTAYDQSLNTTDSVVFASLQVGGILLDLPTSPYGLTSGQAWVDTANGNVIKVV